MRPLLIDVAMQEKIDAAVALAKAKPTPWETLAAYAVPSTDKGRTLKLADRNEPDQEIMGRSIFVDIPMGYRAAISFEQQPAGLFRHLSVSVAASVDAKAPSPHAFEMIAMAFGFLAGDKPRRMWLEEFAPGEYAVNLIEMDAVN